MWSKKELIEKQARFWVLMAQGSTLKRLRIADLRLAGTEVRAIATQIGGQPGVAP